MSCSPAVGIQSSIEGSILEELGVAVRRGKVCVDEFYRTNVPGIYAIGDIVPARRWPMWPRRGSAA